MTMYILLLLCTALAAAIAVWVYRVFSSWRLSQVSMVSLSGATGRSQPGRQRGFIGSKRRADGSVVWTRKKIEKTGHKSARPAGKSIKQKSGNNSLRKPWGW